MPDRRKQLGDYLRRRLQETGVTMRQLSLVMTQGRDQSFVGQLLVPPPGKQRSLPTPDQLRLAAPLLRVPLRELLQVAWGISRAELDDEFRALEVKLDEDAAVWRSLTESQREEVRTFIAFIRARDAMRKHDSPERDLLDS